MLLDLGDNQANPNPQLQEMIGEFSNQVTKKTEFDHHFTSYLCLLRSTPQTLSNTIRAFFSSWGTKTHPTNYLISIPNFQFLQRTTLFCFGAPFVQSVFFVSAQPNPNHADSKKAIRSRASPNPRGKIQNSLLPRPVLLQKFSHPTFGS